MSRKLHIKLLQSKFKIILFKNVLKLPSYFTLYHKVYNIVVFKECFWDSENQIIDYVWDFLNIIFFCCKSKIFESNKFCILIID